ncbi:MAG: NB-ARC domain-containing protein [Bacteroidota bacterium]
MEPRTNSKYLTFVQTVNPNDIVGREKDLAELHSRLSEHKAVLLVNGMGGVGKTTLAAAYVFKYAHQYEKIAWITQSEEGVVSSFIQNQQLLQSLQIQLEGKTPFDLLEEILFKLNNLPEQSKLLILDNTNLAIQAISIKSPPHPIGPF